MAISKNDIKPKNVLIQFYFYIDYLLNPSKVNLINFPKKTKYRFI